jgi:hypothetical protein
LSRGGCQNRRHLLRNWDHGDSTTSRFGRGGASGAMGVLAHQHHPPDGLSQAPERRHRLASPELHPSPLPCPRERCRLLKPPALLPTPANGAGLNISGHEQTLHPVNLRQTAAKRTQRRAMVRLNNFWIGASAAWVHSQPPRRHCPAPPTHHPEPHKCHESAAQEWQPPTPAREGFAAEQRMEHGRHG